MWVEVVDQGGPGQPRVTGPHPDRSGGMGLLLVDALTGGRWGWHGDDSGRTVWAELCWKAGP